nr:purine-binding chemotaxis protein CheW [Desulfobulbaceae bacterium]
MPNQNGLFLLDDTIVKHLVFQIGEVRCGIDILGIEGINWVPAITPVFGAPDYVKGLLNLRGQLVTVFDLGKRLGLEECQLSKKSRIIIIKQDMEYIGLLVDSVSEVISSQLNSVEPPPANTIEPQATFFSGILNMENKLTTILNIEEITRVSELA